MAVEGAYVCKESVEWVRKIMDPQCSAEERALCHRRVEELKEHSPHCLAYGFQLACDGDSIIRHFGLQLLEHFVRYRWQSLQETAKQHFSMQLLQHLSESILPMESEAPYVKESLSRLVVELAKQTWPQYWPTFLEDLDVLTHCGVPQVEVVLLVFRRLAEDLHSQSSSSSSLTSARRKEMSAALRHQITAVFQFLLDNLESPVVPSLRGVALSTVTCYVDWMQWTHLLTHNCKLLRLLYSFISEEGLKTEACECLLAVLSRKGDVKRTAGEREKLLVLLSKDALQVILDASLQAASQGVNEVQYVFLKRVCQVLVELGTSQLALLWDARFQPPEGFKFYLEVMLEFFKHQSQLLCMTVASQWSTFLSHNYIKDHPSFRSILPDLYPVACRKLHREGNPCSSSSDAVTEYNRIDFDDQNEYTTFYSMFRNRLTIMLSKMCQQTGIPHTAFTHTLKLATSLTQQAPAEECSKESELYLQWDAFVGVLECWANVLKTDLDLKSILSGKATTLTQMVLTFDPRDPLLLCCVLRCMLSGLIWLLDLDTATLLQPYLQKIFSCIQYLGELRSKEKKVLAAQNIAMQCFVKLCTKFGDTLVPYLGQLYEQYQTLAKNDLLTYSVKSSFTEGFVILNQLCPDVQQQTVFLGQLMQEASTIFHDLQQCGALASLEGLIRYLGLHTTPADAAFCPAHRAQLCYLPHVLNMVLKKSTNTGDHSVAQAVSLSPEQYPCYQLTLPLLSQFALPMISLLHELWCGKSKPLTSPFFQGVYELTVGEKEVMRGKVLSFGASQPPQVDDLSQMQHSIVTTLDVCLQCVVHAFSVFGCKHMLDIGLVEPSIQALFSSAAGLNSWKIRGVVRAVVQPMVKFCPADQWQTVLLPFMTHCCHVVFAKLKLSWESIEQRQPSDDVTTYEDGAGGGEVISQEVIEEQFTIILSRDYANLLETVCMLKKEQEGLREGEGEGRGGRVIGGDEEMEEVREGSAAGQNCSVRDKWTLTHDITPLALELLASKGLMSELLFLSVFSGLAWGDTKCAHTFTTLAGLLIIKIPEGSLPMELVKQFFIQVLIALKKHGMHEGNMTALTNLAQLMYETMAAQNSAAQLQEVLIQLPRNNAQKMQAFDALLLGEETGALCKKRRAKFRELVSGVCGEHVSESFRRPVVFDLPEMVFKKQAKENTNEPVSLISLFGEDPVGYS